MLRHIKKLAAVMVAMPLAALILIGAAQAAESRNEVEIGIAWGQSIFDPELTDLVVPATTEKLEEENDDVVQLTLSHQVSDAWKLQLRYVDFGQVEVERNTVGTITFPTIDYKALAFAGQYTLPVLQDSDMSLFAVIGLARIEADTDEFVLLDQDIRSEEVLLGLGANYAVGESWAVQFEGAVYAEDLSALTLGLHKTF